MVVGCTLISGLEFDMFSTSIAKILGDTLLSVWLFLHFFFVSLFCLVLLFFACLFVCSFLLLLVLSFLVKVNVLATLVQNPSFK